MQATPFSQPSSTLPTNNNTQGLQLFGGGPTFFTNFIQTANTQSTPIEEQPRTSHSTITLKQPTTHLSIKLSRAVSRAWHACRLGKRAASLKGPNFNRTTNSTHSTTSTVSTSSTKSTQSERLFTQQEVLQQVSQAISETKARIDTYKERKAAKSTERAAESPNASEKFDRRIDRLTVRQKDLEALKTHFETTNEWQKFGGFTGWNNSNLEETQMPVQCGFGQFHGWLKQTEEGWKYQEISLKSGLSDRLTTASVITNASVEKSSWNSIADFFKGTDGWDEIGSGLGQTLPGIGQHVATFCTLTVLSPFVYLGVKGMASELDEAKQKLESIFKSESSSEQRLIEALKLSNDLFNKLDEGERGNESETSLKGDKNSAEEANSVREKRDDDQLFDTMIEKLKTQKGKPFERSAMEIAKHLRIKADKQSAIIANQATPLGLAAMTGMFGGVCAGSTASFFEILASANTSLKGLESLEILAAVFEVVTASVFIPAQLAMILYAGKKIQEGQLVHEHLDKKSEHLTTAFRSEHAANTINEALFDPAEDNLHRLKRYNRRSKIYYGHGIRACEAGMIAGGVLGLLGQVKASMAVMLPSAAGTLLAAGFRIQQEGAAGTYVGREGGHIHDGKVDKAWTDVFRRITEKHFPNMRRETEESDEESDAQEANQACGEGCTHPPLDGAELEGQGCDHHQYNDLAHHNPTPLASMEESHHEITEKLAESKIHSLMLSNIRAHRTQGVSLLKQVKTGCKHPFRRTSLQKDLLSKMQLMTQGQSNTVKLAEQIDLQLGTLHKLTVLTKALFSVGNTRDEYALRQQVIRALCDDKSYHQINKALDKRQSNRFLFGFKHNKLSVKDLFETCQPDRKVLKAFYQIVLEKRLKAEKSEQKIARQANFENLYLHASALALDPTHEWRKR